jgi:hypothetical protein
LPRSTSLVGRRKEEGPLDRLGANGAFGQRPRGERGRVPGLAKPGDRGKRHVDAAQAADAQASLSPSISTGRRRMERMTPISSTVPIATSTHLIGAIERW